MKGYTELVTAQTIGRACDHCGIPVPQGSKYLHLVKNRHTYIICGKCLTIFATLAIKDDPTHKADAMAELI